MSEQTTPEQYPASTSGYAGPGYTSDARYAAAPGQPAHVGNPGRPGYAYSSPPYDQPSTSFGAPTASPLPQPAPAPRPSPRRGAGARLASTVLVAVLAAGVGGGAGLAVDRYALPHATSTAAAATVTRVIQGSTSAPDWSVTAAAVSPSVVSITVTAGQGEAQGSGVILDTDGHVVTNNHVVSALGSGAQITVGIGDQVYTASLVGTDPSSDLAVIKIDNAPTDLKPITDADAEPKVGDPVMAIGNPLGLSDSVTTGIVSALNRPVTTQSSSSGSGSRGAAAAASAQVVTSAIQTSAAINPGNSGGALVNADGELVGINSSIASLGSSSSGQSGSIGIGFAIPASQVSYIADQLIQSGTADHAYLGLSATDGTAGTDSVQTLGAQVAQVASGSPAAGAGITTDDVIIALDNTPVVSAESLIGQIHADKVGQQIQVTLFRGGQKMTLTVTLGSSNHH